jgi:hypothetical protein
MVCGEQPDRFAATEKAIEKAVSLSDEARP